MRLLPVITGALVAGSVLAPAAGPGFAGPGHARSGPGTRPGLIHAGDIQFDPATYTGFVGAEDVRTAFGWDEATLSRNAARVGFTYHVAKKANYAVVCERGVRAEADYNPGSTSAGLITVAAWDGAAGGLTGFRLTGTNSGASSMTNAPEPGLPCPDDRGGTIRKVTYLNTDVASGLTAEFGDVQVYFPWERTVSTTPPD